MNVPTRRLGAVEGLRAFAACTILYYHLQRAVTITHPGLIPAGVVSWSERLGPFGVGIFFVLSGFLLYRPFVMASFADTPTPILGRYFVRRFARIYPAYWVALAFLLVVVAPEQVRDRSDWFVFFGLFQNYRTGSLLRGLGVAWTLVIEVSFYLVLPLLAWLLRSRAASIRRRLARQVVGLSVMFAAGLGVRVWALWSRTPGQGRIGAFQPFLAPDLWLPGYLDWFALGMGLAVASAWFSVPDRRPRFVQWFEARTWPAWLAAVVVYRLVLLAPFPRPGFGLRPGSQMLVTTVLPFAAALIVAPVVLAPEGRGLGMRILGSRPAVAVGTVAYGIYLWHLIFLTQVSRWITDHTIPRSALIQVILVIGLTGVAATASFVFLEAPFMRWSSRMSATRRASSPSSIAATDA